MLYVFRAPLGAKETGESCPSNIYPPTMVQEASGERVKKHETISQMSAIAQKEAASQLPALFW
jgi:hypothetical protein